MKQLPDLVPILQRFNRSIVEDLIEHFLHRFAQVPKWQFVIVEKGRKHIGSREASFIAR